MSDKFKQIEKPMCPYVAKILSPQCALSNKNQRRRKEMTKPKDTIYIQSIE